MLRRIHGEQSLTLSTASKMSSGFRSPPREHEGLIPVKTELYFVVDCPSLHIIPATHIGPRQQCETDAGLSTLRRPFCPQCQQKASLARQIPSTCWGYSNNLIPPRPISPLSVPSPSPSPLQRLAAGSPETHCLSVTSSSPTESLDQSATQTSFNQCPFGLKDVSLSFRPYSPPLPEVVPPQADRRTTASRSPSVFWKSSGGFLSRWRSPPPPQPKSPRPSKSVTSSHDSVGSTLPRYLSFCFSMSGKSLLLWKKDSRSVVRIELESYGSRVIDMTDKLPPSDEAQTVNNIRYVAEGDAWIAVVMTHNQRLILLVFHSSGLAEESSFHFVKDQLDPRCLAISPDNNYVAIGFGTHVHLFNYQGCRQQWRAVLSIPDFTVPAEVLFQALNFSSDNTTLVAATQRHDKLRSSDDDAISTYVWQCKKNPPPPLTMGSCKMPTDGQGLTSIFYHPASNLSFITGAVATPYPLFLSPSTSPPPPPPSNVTDFRIRCACGPHTPTSNIAYFMDEKNKIHRVNLQSRSVTLVANLNLERGSLRVKEEPAAICVDQKGKVRVFWRQGAGLWICTVGDGGRKEKKNLRGLWEDASLED